MLIKSLKLKNFRQYKGDQPDINFSCNPDKNVTIIIGNNTYGKTTLLQAFIWCLYGKADFKSENQLLNTEIEFAMDNGDTEEIRVSLSLIHKNIKYEIIRLQEYIKRNNRVYPKGEVTLEMSYEKADGQKDLIKNEDINDKINEILPEDLSDYFFFDAERIQTISSKKDVNSSVKGILGLTVLENIIDHIGHKNKKNSVIGKFEKMLDKKRGSNAQKIYDEISQLKKDLVELSDEEKDLEKKSLDVSNLIKDNEFKIRENKNVFELQERVNKLDKKLYDNEEKLNYHVDHFKGLFKKHSKKLYTVPLYNQVLEIINSVYDEDNEVMSFSQDLILEIINKGECICGNRIVEGDKAHTVLKNEIQKLKNKYARKKIIGIKNSILNSKFDINQFWDSIKEDYKKTDEIRNDLLLIENESDDIKKEIEGKLDTASFYKNIRIYKNKLKDIDKRLKQIENDRAKFQVNLDHKSKEYDEHILINDNNRKVNEYIRYANELQNWVKVKYRDKSLVIKNKLELEVSKIFNEMYHGERIVKIDENYNTQLIASHNGQYVKVDESTGLDTVKNFAFIGGLVELAKDKIISDLSLDSLELNNEPYPLVMDAPFSNADSIHVSSISKVLPKVVEQVIIIVMQKDWNHAKTELYDKVGKYYRLKKITETHTEMEELEIVQ